MAKKVIGIEIGSDSVKLALCSGGQVLAVYPKRLPEHLVREGRITAPEAMVQILAEMRKENKLPKCPAALILPGQSVIGSIFTMPLMTIKELELNLPFEFRDYVGPDGSKYRYDYVVRSVDTDTNQMEIYGAAVRMEVIDQYYDMLKKAGFTLAVAIPAEMAWQNILAMSEDHPKELCVLDVGHTSITVSIYANGNYMMGKVIEMGCTLIDETISAETKQDVHVCRTYRESNMNNIQSADVCLDAYGTIAVEVMKVVNFYGYQTPGSGLQDIYFCGGGSAIEPLREAIQKATGMNMHHINRLVPGTFEDNNTLLCATAVGAGIQQ